MPAVAGIDVAVVDAPIMASPARQWLLPLLFLERVADEDDVLEGRDARRREVPEHLEDHSTGLLVPLQQFFLSQACLPGVFVAVGFVVVHDLVRINLDLDDLFGWSFVGW